MILETKGLNNVYKNCRQRMENSNFITSFYYFISNELDFKTEGVKYDLIAVINDSGILVKEKWRESDILNLMNEINS